MANTNADVDRSGALVSTGPGPLTPTTTPGRSVGSSLPGGDHADADSVVTGRDFEIAIAIAITAFSPTVALATVVGPLIEVPIMLALVWSAIKLRPRLFPAPPGSDPPTGLELTPTS